MLLLEEQNVAKAEEAINLIKIKTLKDYLSAALAIVKQDWQRFNELKSKVKPNFKYSLEADEAFKIGDFDRRMENVRLRAAFEILRKQWQTVVFA